MTQTGSAIIGRQVDFQVRSNGINIYRSGNRRGSYSPRVHYRWLQPSPREPCRTLCRGWLLTSPALPLKRRSSPPSSPGLLLASLQLMRQMTTLPRLSPVASKSRCRGLNETEYAAPGAPPSLRSVTPDLGRFVPPRGSCALATGMIGLWRRSYTKMPPSSACFDDYNGVYVF